MPQGKAVNGWRFPLEDTENSKPYLLGVNTTLMGLFGTYNERVTESKDIKVKKVSVFNLYLIFDCYA